MHHMRADRLQRERAVAALARRQHGVVARWQLPFGRSIIFRWIESGRLHPVYRGVYAVGHSRLSVRGRWMAAVLAGGFGALLSHGDAAALWDLLPIRSGRIHVTVPRRGVHAQPGLILHATARLDPSECRTRDANPGYERRPHAPRRGGE
jgi:hypothetical protein